MTGTMPHSESAKILAFPAKGHFAPKTQADPRERLNAPLQPVGVDAGAWYHEAAIQEDQAVHQ